jgi:hypothetical protein
MEAPARPPLFFGLGFGQTDNALTFFELAAFFQKFDAFKSFEDTAAGFDCALSFQAGMLAHRPGSFPEYCRKRK